MPIRFHKCPYSPIRAHTVPCGPIRCLVLPSSILCMYVCTDVCTLCQSVVDELCFSVEVSIQAVGETVSLYTVARGLATWQIRHRRYATQQVRHTNVTENLSVSVGQTFATVLMWKIHHTTVIGWGWGGGWVEGLG